ncbi:prolyl 4-hydroxylase subunit alpha-1-like [Mytilus californianus]|uniref:prolyl 4-hydroxylase subunit alpha-1-like n=1 Tax=Mytilus californianus TaxID=6549 RepID=UPI00224816DE|nr:prolyl 4-hydroxylase subunit alpha-1-like [Mytilus californianus]
MMKRLRKFLYFCVSLLHVCHIHGEIFSSVYKLSIISKEEGKLLSAFNKYISTQARDQKSISFELQRLLNDLEPIVTESFQDPRYAEHPINAFHLIGRFVYKWPVVYSSILCEDCTLDDAASDLNATYQVVTRKIGHWPDEYDVQASAQALLRLRTFYYFNIDEAINGVLFDEHCQPLNPSQILKIVSIAKDSSMLNEARLWSEALLRRLPFTSFLDENVNEASILKVVSSIYEQAGLHHKALAILGSLITDEHNEVLNENEQIDINEEEEADISFVREEYDDAYKQLCRENQKTPKESSKLYCYLSSTVIPYYKGKVEIANLQPKIFLFHDVISEREALHLRNEGSKEFHRSKLGQGQLSGSEVDKTRVSETAWLHDKPGIVIRATQRVGLLTGLKTKSSPLLSNTEPFQIVNYGIGGMYNPHYDTFEKPLWGPISEDEPDDLRGTGDRIATWLFYLNDVKVGGATVFPNINTRIPVIQGGAAFWYNLLPSGLTDNRTVHAGCPVVIGSKWVGNKWIREAGQMFRRPCDLHP